MFGFFFTLVATVALSLLFPNPQAEQVRIQKLDPHNFPRANAADPVPVIFGTVLLKSPNTIWYGDFYADPQYSPPTGILEWLFNIGRQIISYKYYVGLDLALCMGPDVTLLTVYANQFIYFSGATSGVATGFSMYNDDVFSSSCTFYEGHNTQPIDSYVNSQVTEGVPAYNGICHLVLNHAFIGTSPQLSGLAFELQRFSNNLGLPSDVNIIGKDLNAMEIVYSIFVDTANGMSVDPRDINTIPGVSGSLWDAAHTIALEQNGSSLILSTTSTGAEVVAELMRQVDGIMYQDASTGKVCIKLIRNDFDVNSIPAFNEGNIEALQKFTRSTWINTYNQIRVKYVNRIAKYEDGIAVVQDLSNITSQGRIMTLDVSYPTAYDSATANKLASRDLAQHSIPLITMTIETNRDAFSMKPGDPFKFSWGKFGIDDLVMRVTSIDLGKLQDNRIVIEAIQDAFSTSLTIFGNPIGIGSGPVTAIEGVIDPFIEELPKILANMTASLSLTSPSNTQGFIAVFAAAGNSRQIGYETDHSYDSFATTIPGLTSPPVPFSSTASLLTHISPTDGFVSNILPTVVIDALSLNGTALSNTSLADMRTSKGLMLIGSELMAYETVVNNMDGTFTLSNVHRALLDTSLNDHSTGQRIYFISNKYNFVPVPFNTGVTLTTKIKASIAGATQSDVDPSTVTENVVLQNRYNRPLSPKNIFVTIDSVPLDEHGVPIPGYIVGAPIRQLGQIVPAGAVLTVSWSRRNANDTAIQLFADADEVQEAGTTYTLTWALNGVITTVHGITGNSYTFGLPLITGEVAFTVTAVNGSLSSYSIETYTSGVA